MSFDFDEITRQVKEVIGYSQSINPNELNGVDRLMEKWWDNKLNYFYLFGEKLIVRSEEKITFELDADARQRQLEKFVDRIAELYCNEALADFVYSNMRDFYNNILSRNYEDIPKGSKIIKSFKYFEHDKDRLRAIQDEASMLIQETKISGYLCMSIHPLDYLSSSENTYKWRSCHALDGEYRAGNLSYMTDKSTIVCYLEGDREVKLPNFPETIKWNSKKWRMLLNTDIHNHLVFAGRQYPFFSYSALEEIRKQFLPIVLGPIEYLSDWHNDTKIGWDSGYNMDKYDENENTFPFNHHSVRHFFPGRIPIIDYHLIKNGSDLHYNDYLESHIYTKPYYCWDVKMFYPATEIRIGRKVRCTRCGKQYITESNSMICDECEEILNDTRNITYCACCDRRFYRNDITWELADGDIVCADCARAQTEVCDRCGRRFYRGTMEHINNRWLCSQCEIEESE